MIGSVTLVFVFYLYASYALELTCMDMENTRRKQYRKDYVYSPMNDVFYKQHTELKEYEQARDLCNNEGSELMVPSSWHDVMQLDEIIKKYPDLESVWIGDIFKEDLSTTNPLDKEQQLNHNQHKALTRNAKIVDVLKTKQLPFICSVKSDEAPFNSQCNVHGKDYQYMAATRSCYKISGLLMTWNEAYLECQNEGSHLVILNSNIEQEVVFNLVKKMPNIPDDGYLSAGFKAMKTPHDVPRVFKTIFNETLEEAGYNEWAKNEPNNGGGVEDCGSIYMTEGKLNDCACTVAVDYNYYNFAYICEKEIPT